MQAKKKLDFVSPHDPFGEKPKPSKGEIDETLFSYILTCRHMIAKHRDYARSAERLEDVGFVTVFEVPLQIVAPDGSYLHIVIGGSHYDNQGNEEVLDLIVSVVEHQPDGTAGSGYMYTVYDGTVNRSEIPDDVGEKTDEHFSFIELVEFQDELELMTASDDEVTAREAQELKKSVEEAVLVANAERLIGLDDLPVDYDEVEKLRLLLEQAIPFTAKPVE